jgi:alanyl-tRNA synthetase
MTAQEIRKNYLEFFKSKQHAVIPRALLVPQDDPTTLFTGSGMQPLLPYLLGQAHPNGQRLVNSQTCLRAQDIDEVGDSHHTTFFEMLGNWSLGDYFKQEQLSWYFEFLTEVIGLNPERLYISCFSGFPDYQIPKDQESADVWRRLLEAKGLSTKEVDIGSMKNGYQIGDDGGRIFFYDDKNWWSRVGSPADMPDGEPGGPDSEVFYRFDEVMHDPKWGEKCHPNCECGRYVEIGNSVFMEYIKKAGAFEKLPKKNVDFGGGLERLTQATINSPDIFQTSLLKPIITKLEELSGKDYAAHAENMRVITDHLRGATFLAVDGIVPSNKTQGYVLRRLVRRAIRFAFELGIEQNFLEMVIPVITDLYNQNYPEVAENQTRVIETLAKEEKIFRQTLRKGLTEFSKLAKEKIGGELLFKLYDTYGFPVELTKEEAFTRGISITEDADTIFQKLMEEQRERSRTATKGEFKGGLSDQSEITTKYHTATHLLYKALKTVLGNQVVQRGANITAERIRFDFSNPEKVTPEQITEIEKIVNQQIDKDWPVSWREENTKEALAHGVAGAFGDRYGEVVKVYTIGDPEGDNFSREICGGPHVEHTGALGEGGKRFKIIKEESSSAGVRRIKAVLT